jgi:hypothetical protein
MGITILKNGYPHLFFEDRGTYVHNYVDCVDNFNVEKENIYRAVVALY